MNSFGQEEAVSSNIFAEVYSVCLFKDEFAQSTQTLQPQTATPHVGTSSKRPSLSVLLFVAPYQVNANLSHMAWTDFAALRLLFKSGHITIIGCGSLRLLTWTSSSFSEKLPTNPVVCPSNGIQ